MTRDPGLESWIVDASPLILLGNIGQLALLEALAPRIKVPEAVLEEVAASVDLDPQGGVTLAWAKVHTVPNIPLPQSIAGWDLGAGESQVVAHCLAGARRAVLDDAEGRACRVPDDCLMVSRGGLLPSIVEKDYVLGWLLAGINEHPDLTDAWCGAHPALGRSNESGCHTAVG